MLMAKSPSSLSALSNFLSPYGLFCFGGFEITKNECAVGSEVHLGKKALLIGNAGFDMWRVFSQSSEYADSQTNPMNRWTKRVLDELSNKIDAKVAYPFDEPYWPFQRIAQKAAVSQSSPLGILIHPKFGLWHAFRGVLIFEHSHQFSSQISALIEDHEALVHPCDTCEDKPCLSACPVGAFTGERLDVQSCFNHLDTTDDPQCMALGCLARNACPIAKERRYDEAQIKFHMKSYRGL